MTSSIQTILVFFLKLSIPDVQVFQILLLPRGTQEPFLPGVETPAYVWYIWCLCCGGVASPRGVTADEVWSGTGLTATG